MSFKSQSSLTSMGVDASYIYNNGEMTSRERRRYEERKLRKELVRRNKNVR